MIKLELPEQMIAVIGEALGEYKFRLSAPIVAEIQRQYDAQKLPQLKDEETKTDPQKIKAVK